MDEGGWRRARGPRALALIAVGGVVLRLVHLVTPGGPFGFNLDPGVYYGAAGLLVTGHRPYGEFAFLHPPGILVILAPIAWLGEHVIGHAAAFVVAAALSAIAAGVTIFGIGWLASRWRGPGAGLGAALLYATFVPAVVSEGDVLLEPFVNVLFVATALSWSAPRSASSDRRRLLVTGGLVALTTLVKLTGAVAGFGCLVSGPFRRPWIDRAVFAAGVALVGLVVVLPFVIGAGGDRFFGQVVATQLGRPPAGGLAAEGNLSEPGARLLNMLGIGPLGLLGVARPAGAGSPLALVLLPAGLLLAGWAWLRGGAPGRFWTATWIFSAVLLLAAPSYFVRYPSTLMVSTAVLLGAGVATLADLVRGRFGPGSTPLARRALTGVGWVAVLALILPTVAVVAGRELVSYPRPDVGATIRALVPPDMCVYADPPSLSIASGRLPPSGTAEPLADPFGEPLWLALRSSRRYASIEDALWSKPAQDRIRDALVACPYIAFARPIAQQHWLSPETRAWLVEQVEQIVAPTGGGVGLWRRR